MGCLRKIKGVTRRDKIRNVDIRKELGVTTDIVQKIQARRLRYYGHVVRMKAESSTEHSLVWMGSRKKEKRTPKKRWIDNIRET